MGVAMWRREATQAAVDRAAFLPAADQGQVPAVAALVAVSSWSPPIDLARPDA